MTDDHAVQTLRQAAAGWRELGAHVEDIIQTLDREVSLARAAHWSGSGAEGFDEQWVRLRGAVEEVLPSFAAAAADLEGAAEAAQAAVDAALEAERAEQERNDAGVGSFDGEDDMFGGDLGAETGGGAAGGSHSSSSAGGGDIDSRVGAPAGDDTLAKLDAVLRSADGQSAAADGGLTSVAAGASDGPAEPASSTVQSRVGDEPGEERADAGTASAPPALGTAAVLASLSQFAATLADVFTHQPLAPDTPAPNVPAPGGGSDPVSQPDQAGGESTSAQREPRGGAFG